MAETPGAIPIVLIVLASAHYFRRLLWAPMSRQRRVGAASREETARRLLAAARDEFGERGYAGATVTRIAARANVTVQTLYLAWGSKRALLRAYLEQTLGGGAPYPGSVVGRFAGLDPAAVVAKIADLFLEIAGRSATGRPKR